MNVKFISGVRISSAHRLLSIAAMQNRLETREHTRALVPNVLKQQIPLKNTDFHLPVASFPIEIHVRVTKFLAHKIECVWCLVGVDLVA